MKIDFSKINKTEFNVIEKFVNQEVVYLIFPRINPNWNSDNLIFRSSVWNLNGELVSPSFKKFFNWNERIDLVPNPNDVKNCHLIEKIDGSTLIVSNYKDNIIIRTRGTIDYHSQENAFEIDNLKNVYSLAFNPPEGFTWIYEWISPFNKIVLDYGENSDIYLISAINHSTYSMYSQICLDVLALDINVKRPKVYHFDTINEMIATIENLKGYEGICCYFDDDQQIKKLKSIEYLTHHRFKYQTSFEDILDLYLEIDRPEYNTFVTYIEKKFDYECCNIVKPIVSTICDINKEIELTILGMKIFVNRLQNLSRKEAAEIIISSYGKTSRSSFVFNLLSGKELDNKDLKKLFFQFRKKL